MRKPLKILSLNIERAKHYGRWMPFVQKNDFDVICLQEVFQSDCQLFEKELGGKFIFAPMGNITRDDTGEHDVMGIAIGFFIPYEKTHIQYYTAPYNPEGSFGNPDTFKSCPRVLLGATCLKDDATFRISTTHFTWTPDGESNMDQEKDLKNLLDILQQYNEIILCGDMNAPRGKIIFDTIAKKYIDHIPRQYTNSIDTSLHRNPDLEFMVDALFSTPHYQARNVELVAGLSDHMGIIAELYRE